MRGRYVVGQVTVYAFYGEFPLVVVLKHLSYGVVAAEYHQCVAFAQVHDILLGEVGHRVTFQHLDTHCLEKQ